MKKCKLTLRRIKGCQIRCEELSSLSTFQLSSICHSKTLVSGPPAGIPEDPHLSRPIASSLYATKSNQAPLI